MTFAELGVAPPLVAALADAGIVEPMPVQAAAVPDALAGRDLLVRAVTGSGKTLAFGIPLLQRGTRARVARPVGLVLVPTRELALQVATVLRPLARAVGLRVATVSGGAHLPSQMAAVRRGGDVVVATPGRLQDLIDRRLVTLDDVTAVVLDEADQLADLGFTPQVRRLLDLLPGGHQTLLFSATLDDEVASVVRGRLREPVLHDLAPPERPLSHRFVAVRFNDKVPVTAAIASAVERTLVFVRTRRAADEIAGALRTAGVRAAAMHGDLRQAARERALDGFRSGRVPVLVATDVAARGLHVEAVDVVIHFDPPHDDKAYVHRSGRTGRAGAAGMAVSLLLKKHAAASKEMQRRLGLDEPIPAVRPEQVLEVLGLGARPAERPPAEPRTSPGAVVDGPGRLRPRRSG